MADLTWERDTEARPGRGEGPLRPLLALVTALVGVLLAVWGGLMPLAGLLGAALALPAVAALVVRPERLLALLVVTGFAATGASRYVPLPLGLSTDALLVLLLVVLLGRLRGQAWFGLGHPLSLGIAAWLVYNLFQLLNPEARSGMAWLYAVRGAAAYMSLTWLALQLLDGTVAVRRFLHVWLICAGLAAAWGARQQLGGLDPWEDRWLQEPGNRTTHLLFGNLRAFSFMSDAGQFGVVMAYSAFLAALFALHAAGFWRRLGWAGLAALLFWGLALSGTRSAFLVIPIALAAFLVASRNVRVGVPLALVGAVLFGLLAFTYVGQGNYHVARMRGALNPTEDASFQVRIENQKRLIPYLETRPFGGGVGSGGSWGQRFSPGTFLADLALDSYYVKIAAEQGPVGLVGFVVLLGSASWVGFRARRSVKDPEARWLVEGMWSACIGIFVVSYSNQYLGQMPTGIFVYVSFAVFIRAPTFSGAAGHAAPR